MFHANPPRTIGLLTPYLGGIYSGSVIAGAVREARRHGARLIIVQESPRGVYQSRLAWDLVDGWVVLINAEGAEQIAQAGVPVVTLSNLVPGLPAVLPDNHGSMYALVSHLIEHGHQRIAFIGRMVNVDIRQRFEGYQAALAEHAIPFDDRLVIDVHTEMEEGGVAAAHALLESGLSYTAIVAGTDKNALGAMTVLQEAGYAIPQDLAIVGFDDLEQSQTVDPPLTTVRQRFDLLASTAVERLLAQISDRSLAPDPIYGATAMITRRSCGCEPGQSPLHAALAGIAGTEGWRAVLEQQLVLLCSYPFAPDPSILPTQVWPGMATLIEVIEGAITGRALPSAAAIEDAWREAIALTLDVDMLKMIFDLIERAGLRLLVAAPRDDAAPDRLADALRLIRGELLRVRVARETVQVGDLDRMLYANNEISTAMLINASTSAPTLDWLGYTSAQWACLGLWTDPTEQTELVLTSSYAREGQAQPFTGSQFAPATFPLRDASGTLAQDDSDVITLIPLRTDRRAWGVLAIGGLVNTSGLTWNSDPLVMWSRMLGSTLDRAALLAELNQQREELGEQRAILQAAYDRERVLASTVRDIGCPVIPLMPGVILIPLIGALDSDRAQQIIKVGLEAVNRERATDVLIDVTGVPIIDTQVAAALIRMARMASLLGARTMLVGVRPEIAQSIVGLGIDLTQIMAYPSLAAAITQLRRGRPEPRTKNQEP